jgi:hypothetical protein
MRFGRDKIIRSKIYVKSRVFEEMSRKIQGAFTRIRKLTLYLLILTIIERRGVTLSMEIRGFMKKGLLKERITKTAYLKARKKLNPLALLNLAQYHNRGLYADGEMQEYKGYLILSEDGSSLNVPTTAETLEKWGNSSTGTESRAQANLGLSCLYDCINKSILTVGIHKHKFNEAEQAEKHLAELPELVGDKKSILMLDRGYPSIPLFLRLNEQGQKYVVRLGSTYFKAERKNMKSNDETVESAITKSRLQNYKGTPDYDMMIAAGSLRLRLVNFTLPSGTVECLATNLPESEFTTDEITALYPYRWGIETAFDTLKNKLSIENFTGTAPVMIEQDIYASIYICNLASDMIADAEEGISEDGLYSDYKHKIAVNRAFAIGILKDMLISAILADSHHEMDRLFDIMIEEIKAEVLPVRPNRHYKRKKGLRTAKFHNNRKRSF